MNEYDDDPSHEREREIAQAVRELRDGWAEIAREAEDAMESERDLQRDVQTLRELKQGHEHWIREYDDELQRIRKGAQESKRVYDEWVREFERDPSHFIEEYYLPDPAALVTESLEDDD